MLNQKDAVTSNILAVLSERDVEYKMGGDVRIIEVLTDKDKATVREALFVMFRDGSVSYTKDFQWKVDDDKELKKYVSGLVNNWTRKNKEFNCGKAYVPANPGSRAGAGDEKLKALKLLQAEYSIDTNSDEYAQITEAIVKRKAEITASKPSAVIRTEALPEHLRHLVK